MYSFTSHTANKSNYGSARQVNTIKYIVVHYTANNGDTAKGNGNYFASNNVGASAHYFVDEDNVVQSVPDNYTAWHCGGTTYYHSCCRNGNSIGVELCSRKDSKGNYYFKDETVENALELVRSLMNMYNIPAANVIRHYDVTHKVCPAPFVNNTVLWQNFKNRLEVKNVIQNYDEAIDVLVKKGVVESPVYWNNAIKAVKHLDRLIINMANKLI